MAEGGDADDRAAELTRLKTEIFVSIIPEKDPVPAHRVNKLYRDEWRGKDIPFADFGFNNLDAFLMSLSDMITLSVFGGEKRYKAASMESTKHVQALVSRQRAKPKKRRSASGGMARGGYRGSFSTRGAYTGRGMGFAGPARTAPPHLTASSNHHEGKQRILSLLRRSGGQAYYADIQRLYSDEYHRNLDQQELRRLFSSTDTALRIFESVFRNEIHVTEPSQGRLYLKQRDFATPIFGGGGVAPSMRGGANAAFRGRGAAASGFNPLSRPQAPTGFSKFIPPRQSTATWSAPSIPAAPTFPPPVAAAKSNSTVPLTVMIGSSGANRSVTMASTSSNCNEPIQLLPHSKIMPHMPLMVAGAASQHQIEALSTYDFTNSSMHTLPMQALPPSPARSNQQRDWIPAPSSSSMSAMAQISNRTPSIVKLLDHLVAMLVKRHPRGIPLAQLGEAYAQDYDLQLDTEAIYRKTWRDLVLGQFKDRVMLDTDNVVHLSPKEVSRQNFSSAPIAQLAQRAVIATQRAPAPAPAPPVVSPPVTAGRPMSVRTPPASVPSATTLIASTTQPTVMTENIRRLFQVASQSSPQGLPISTVSALIGCPEPDALRIAVVQYSQFFQIKFVEGTCFIGVKPNAVLPPQQTDEERLAVVPTPIDFVLPLQSVGFDLNQPIEDVDPSERLMAVQVSDYQSPMRFSLVLVENVPAVTELQKQLADFYGKLTHDECRLPEKELVPGRLCAVEYQGDGDYHRAKIVEVDDDGTRAEVLYLDYGSVQTVPTKAICQLDRRFTTLPAQALLASFLEIRPPRGQQDFSDQLGIRMGELCNSNDLWAMIIHFSAPENKMFVELCTRSAGPNGEDEETWVMEALRSQGLLEVVDHSQSAILPTSDEDEMNALADMLEDVEFVDEDDFEEELADENDDKQSSHSAMSEYRKQLKENPEFVHTLRNMTRIYASIRHQKLEAMGTSSREQTAQLADEVAKIEHDLREMNDLINQYELPPPRNSSPPEDPSPTAK